MSGLTLSCRLCKDDVDGYGDIWQSHLLTERHQLKARGWIETLKEGSRVLVAVGVRNVSPKKVLQHFFNLSVVTNFVFWDIGPRDVCVLEFVSQQLRDTVTLTSTKRHWIDKSLVTLHSREKIKDIHWTSLMNGRDVGNIHLNEDSDEDVVVVCEAEKRRNILDTIDLGDEDINRGDEVPEDLETQMDKVYETNLMPKEQWNFAKSVAEKVEKYLQGTLKSPCKLVRFGFGGHRIRLTKFNYLYFYFDKEGIVEEQNKSGKKKLVVMDYDSPSALDHQLTQIKSALEGHTSSAGFRIQAIKNTNNQITFKYSDVAGSVLCKIYLEEFDTVQARRLLNVYSSLDFRVRPLLLVARQWSRARVWESTLDPEHLQWMVIFFLMRQKILPPVHSLRDKLLLQRDFQFKKQRFGFCTIVKDIISKCGDAYDLQKKGSLDAVTILKLAKKMFQFYCMFDFRNFLINLFVGQAEEKPLKLITNRSALLTISHPLKLKCNMTSLVEEKNLDLFTAACTKAAEAISKLLKHTAVGLEPTNDLLNLLKGIESPAPKKRKSEETIKWNQKKPK